jgi:hypothetical protein
MSVAVTVHCYEFYTTSKINRYKFRYWFSVGLLSVFHLSLAMYAEYTGDTKFNEIRWLTFTVQDILFLEIFTYHMSKRKVELFVRATYYFICIISSVFYFWGFNMIICSILVTLALTNKDYPMNKHFALSFVLYSLTTIVPTVFGYGTFLSFLTGVVFMGHLLVGVNKVYHLEQVEAIIKDGG